MDMENKKREAMVDGITLLKKQCKEMTDEQLMIYLEGHHKSDVYVILTEVLTEDRKKELNKIYGKRYKAVKDQANSMHEHDMSYAKNIDVDRACSIVYGTLLRMIKAQQDDINKLTDRIAKLERDKSAVVMEDEGTTI